MGKRELAEAEILAAGDKLMSFMDDYKGTRWSNATVNLYFALEHTVRALLASADIEAKSHEGIKILFSMHFIKPGGISAKVGRYLGNLYDRRVTAEYSPLRRSEFTRNEVDTYLEWTKESLREIFPLLEKNGLDIESLQALVDKA